MDGGRFINEVLKIAFGNKKAYKITYIFSKTILIILTAISSIAILYLQNIGYSPDKSENRFRFIFHQFAILSGKQYSGSAAHGFAKVLIYQELKNGYL